MVNCRVWKKGKLMWLLATKDDYQAWKIDSIQRQIDVRAWDIFTKHNKKVPLSIEQHKSVKSVSKWHKVDSFLNKTNL